MANPFNPSAQEVSQCFSSAGITLDDVRIQEVPMPEYAVNSIFIVNDNYILKTTTHYSGRNLQRAAMALETVASAGVSPQLITHSEWPSDPNRYFLIQSKLDGKPIQPLYTGHINWWVDYSQGIRLIYRQVKVDGRWMDYKEILKDNRLKRLLCDEEVCDFYYYVY